ncbi:MAG: cell division protein FtsI (penicillin-binding protein 3) [Candidatus Deianiraeaceae bacterium]|jgi:cell division protein FtsI (penicillin-binding protein 3)
MNKSSSINKKLCIFAYIVFAGFTVIVSKILWIQFQGIYERSHTETKPEETLKFRNRIIDRSGNILAISVPAYEYHVNPSFIIDVDVVVDKIKDIFPGVNTKSLHERLSSGVNGWFLVKMGINAEQKQKIVSSGIEGSFFREYYTRFYPYGKMISHTIGYTRQSESHEIGMKGVERSMNSQLLEKDVQLSLDATIQSVIYQEIDGIFKQYRANGAFAVLVDLQTREILSSISLPDFNPTGQINPKHHSHTNIPFSSVFNLGSVFKIFTVALGLENGFYPKQVLYLPREIPVTETFSVRDEHRSRDKMTLEEIVAYSSNVGVSIITQKVGFDKQRVFFQNLKMFEKPSFEIPSGEIASPLFVHKKWKDSMHYTASYGYGISLSPVHFLQIVSGLVYDGKILPLTLLKNTSINTSNVKSVLSEQSIHNLQKMLRSVVEIGTAKKATINGYSICGKTGTSLKFNRELRKWDGEKKFLSFLSVFPCDKPRYAMYIGLDEPTNARLLQAGNTVVEATSNIIHVVAPILNIKPDKDGSS